jgi:hypothetical protein
VKFFRTFVLLAIAVGLLSFAGFAFRFSPLALPVAVAGVSSLLLAIEPS